MNAPFWLDMVAAACALGLTVLACVQGAPEGYEDEEGWHEGSEPLALPDHTPAREVEANA